MHARTHTRTHTHTHIPIYIHIHIFAQAQAGRARAPALRPVRIRGGGVHILKRDLLTSKRDLLLLHLRLLRSVRIRWAGGTFSKVIIV